MGHLHVTLGHLQVNLAQHVKGIELTNVYYLLTQVYPVILKFSVSEVMIAVVLVLSPQGEKSRKI